MMRILGFLWNAIFFLTPGFLFLLIGTLLPEDDTVRLPLLILGLVWILIATLSLMQNLRDTRSLSLIERFEDRFNFDADTLAVNRAGQLTAWQSTRLLRNGIFACVVGILLGGILALMAFNTSQMPDSETRFVILLGGLSIVSITAGVFQLYKTIRARQAGIQRISGTLDVSKKTSHSHTGARGSRRRIRYQMVVRSEREVKTFTAGRLLYDAIRESAGNQHYHVYYVPHVDKVMSVELESS
ncbi:MAG: hypothetical protein AAFQ07_03660 [Chloroflexota bacterium]